MHVTSAAVRADDEPDRASDDVCFEGRMGAVGRGDVSHKAHHVF